MPVPLFITGMAAVLYGAVAMTIVTVMGWGKSVPEGSDGTFAQVQSPEIPAAQLPDAEPGASQFRVKARCDECGEIESMRKVAAVGNSPATYEITVRLRDGSTRVNRDANPANWRPGDRMLLIGGAKPSGR